MSINNRGNNDIQYPDVIWQPCEQKNEAGHNETIAYQDGQYLIFTINRKVLLADSENLQRMLQVISEEAGNIPVIAPLRSNSQLIVRSSQFMVLDSLPYLEFGYLIAHAKGVITDSGNVAEEATFHHVPCITLNSYTEHIETVKQGTNELVGEDADKLRDAMRRMVAGDWKTGSLPDRWDGRSAERIVQILLNG